LKFQYEQERAIHSDPSSPFHSMYFPKMEPAPLGVGVRAAEPVRAQPPTYKTHYDRFPPPVMPPVDIEMTRLPQVMPPMMSEPYYPGNDVFRETPMMKVKPPLMMEQPTPPPMQKIYEPQRPAVMPPLQNLGQVLQRIQQKQPPVDRGFIDRMPRMNVPEGPPPAGMAPVDPNKAMMMKHGGRAAMSKGKR